MVTRRKILVTGSNGQLGRELQACTGDLPFLEFIFTDRNNLDITDKKAVLHWFTTYQPAWIINCAAYTAVDRAEQERDEAFLINATAPGILAAAAEQFNCRMIHISTDYVFDGASDTPYTTHAQTNPQTIYGASKLAGEQAILAASKSSYIIRTSWLYSQFGHNFVKTMLRLMSERTEVSVVDDQLGSPTWAADLASAILQLIHYSTFENSSDQGGILHFSNSGTTSWYQFADAIRQFSNSTCTIIPIPTSAYPTPAKRPHWSVLDCSEIVARFNIALHPWQESLAACIKQM